MKPLLVPVLFVLIGYFKIASHGAEPAPSAGQTPGTHPNEQTFSFHAAFPDKGFAQVVAHALGKKASDVVTPSELAAFSGSIDASFPPNDEPESAGEIQDLTGIGYLSGMTEFAVYKNGVTTLPPEIKHLSNLKVLNLVKAFSLTTLPPEIGQLPKLQELRAALTELGSIPKELCHVKTLKILDVSSTRVSALPKDIGRLTALEELDVHSASITTLPDSLCHLSSLKVLNISYLGHLTKLPENIGALENLESLNLFGDDLRTLPKSMSKMKKLQSLNVYDNFKLSESYKSFLPSRLWQK
jgi:Leucine-rich repeat (LRR) protein